MNRAHRLLKDLFASSRALIAITTLAVVAGCATSGVVHSERHVTNAAPVSSIDVYYVERNLIAPVSSPHADQKLVDSTVPKFGYFEIGPKLTEHGPRLFQLNGLAGSFRQMPASDFSPSTIARSTGSASQLVLEFRHGRVVAQGPVLRSLAMMMSATLYDASGKTRIWSAQFNSHLGHDPALGVAKTTRVDQQYVEGLLAMVLDQMSKEQLVALKDGKASLPSASN